MPGGCPGRCGSGASVGGRSAGRGARGEAAVDQVPWPARPGRSCTRADYDVVVRTAVVPLACPTVGVTGQMTPRGDVQRRRRVGGRQPDDGTGRQPVDDPDQPQEQLSAGEVPAVEDDRTVHHLGHPASSLSCESRRHWSHTDHRDAAAPPRRRSRQFSVLLTGYRQDHVSIARVVARVGGGWARPGSNRRQPRCKRGALPAELQARTCRCSIPFPGGAGHPSGHAEV